MLIGLTSIRYVLLLTNYIQFLKQDMSLVPNPYYVLNLSRV